MAELERFEVELPTELAQREAFHDDISRKIAAGVASLRMGSGVNGGPFMAALDVDFAEQERLGR